ncbi:MAG: hypothetical protein JSS99_04630 [Actinobacteria bacterium]|nr:hypothetical protein [Actinomycetota bacterium]
MKQDSRLLRIWVDITGLVIPLVVMAAYLLGWPSAVRTALGGLFFAGMLSTWMLTKDVRSWRVRQAVRIRRLRRRWH